MSSTITITPSPAPAPTPAPSPAPATAATDARKAVEDEAKAHINTIWQKLENAAEWPVEKLESLISDLKKHL
jgi:hypothetical protein